MGVSAALQDRPINPDMQRGLELIWAFMAEHCPAELAAYQAAWPDRRLNLERINLPGIAMLSRHKKALDTWTQFHAHALADTDFNSAVFNYTQQIKKHLAGEQCDVDDARRKLETSDVLAQATRPDEDVVAKSGSQDLVRVCESTVFSTERPALRAHHDRVMAIDFEGMSVETFEAALQKLDQDYAAQAGEPT